ncbi:Cof-type HAD-IIB family hydrolase [Clostridium felsineum]|uniref:Cof-type HAD-IIB family hydrolase n=1 Tax=Clostridium felsineum TaxID=36839 RepID=UPI00098C58BF|nr:Cof-type HAD-IIB family hydrolase [Clostridium felsineum]MCR3757493.1 Cof-type HAD-IIB family hydrolase [Clostridium felsineum]URZ03079.1 5-amino-6-(5-phospho-D-ribitylamino)uracil phosphatase YcsE [Clostridium felsineum]
MRKAVFFDIDGTLLDCLNGIDKITPRVEKAIRRLIANGDYVFIATGRPFAFLDDELLNFGFDGFVYTNGSYVEVNKNNIYKQAMDKESLKKIINNFERLNVEYILQGEKYSYTRAEYKKLHAFYDEFDISKKYILNDYNIDDIDVYKVEMVCDDEKGIQYCLSLEDENYNYIYDEDIKHLELYSKNNSKASGILKVLEFLDISVENSYAFGDGKNDIEMLETVGCGIAMGNAGDFVKGFAKEVTDTVQNDGVAVGIERFILS